MEKAPVGVKSICPVSGLTLLSLPSYTDVRIHDECFVTLKKAGESIVLVEYRGTFKNCDPIKMDLFFRDFCRDIGVSDKFIMVINLLSIIGHMPIETLKTQISVLLDHGDSISGIVLIQKPSIIKLILLKSLRFFNPELILEVKETYSEAIIAAIKIINEINTFNMDISGSVKSISFDNVLFKPEWEYHNYLTKIRYKVGGISGKLLYISMHGRLTNSSDIVQSGSLLEKVINEGNFKQIPFVMVDYSELEPVFSIRLRHQFVKEAERINRLSGNDKSIQIAIRPDNINRIALRLFAPFIQQKIIIVNDIKEAFQKLNAFSGQVFDEVRDILVSRNDLKELANAFGAMHWNEDLTFPDDQISQGNPLSCLSESLISMKKGLTELMENERILQKQRLKESEAHRRKIKKMLSETELARKDLEKSETSKKILLNNIPTQIWYFGDQNTYGAVNKAHADFMGKDIEALAFRNLDKCLPAENVKIMQQLSQQVFSTGKSSTDEHWLCNAHGEKKCLLISQTPVFFPDGGVDYVVCCAEDISSRKIAEEERERLSAELIQSRKMESVGRLAGGVAHDFNNMLAVISGHVELAMSDVKPESSLYRELMAIQSAAERSADLTRQLLAFARKQVISPKIIDLNSTVSGMLGMLRRLIGEDIELKFRPYPEIWSVKMDPAQVDQMIANLCINARDALNGSGCILIETMNIIFSDKDILPESDMNPGEYVLLTISDNGCGMNEETLSHIFEPFFTTKGVGKGTGLGLATIYGAVKQNSGFIKVISEQNNGTVVKIYLPKYGDSLLLNHNETQKKKDYLLRGTETVLLVEDELMILNVTAGMLEMLGYSVLKARTPFEALRICKNHAGEINLLMTDVIMPGMNGRDLSISIGEMRPSIKQLLMSGYTADVIASRGILEDGVNFIHKPFSMSELAKKIREVLL